MSTETSEKERREHLWSLILANQYTDELCHGLMSCQAPSGEGVADSTREIFFNAVRMAGRLKLTVPLTMLVYESGTDSIKRFDNVLAEARAQGFESEFLRLKIGLYGPGAPAEALTACRTLLAISLGDPFALERVPVPCSSLGDLDGAEAGYEALLAAPDVDRHVQAVAWDAFGFIAFLRQRLDLAIGRKERSHALYVQLGEMKKAADVLSTVGLWTIRDADTSTRYYERALPLYEAIGWEQEIADVCVSLGDLAVRRGDRDKARAHFERALDIDERLKNERGATIMLGSLAEVLQNQRPGEAHELARRAAARSERLGDKDLTATSFTVLAQAARALGNAAEAEEADKRAYLLFQEIGDKEKAATIAVRLGKTAEAVEDWPAAELYFGQARALLSEAGSDNTRMARCDLHLGMLAARHYDVGAATQFLERALHVFDMERDAEGVAEACSYLALAAKLGGDTTAARRHAERAAAHYEQNGNRERATEMQELIAKLK